MNDKLFDRQQFFCTKLHCYSKATVTLFGNKHPTLCAKHAEKEKKPKKPGRFTPGKPGCPQDLTKEIGMSPGYKLMGWR